VGTFFNEENIMVVQKSLFQLLKRHGTASCSSLISSAQFVMQVVGVTKQSPYQMDKADFERFSPVFRPTYFPKATIT
jgi:hypothetical protein